jgi:murein DD-endopeptidase MepM/ murein hydrolase activator NlpD
MRRAYRLFTLCLPLAAVTLCLRPIALLAKPPRAGHSKSVRHSKVTAEQARAANERKLQLRRKLHGMHSHIHQVQARIHRVKVREHQIGQNIHVVEARLGATRNRIERVHTRLKHLAAQHDATVVRMDKTRQRLEKRRDLLGRRVRDNYVRGQISYARVLLEAASIHELMSRGVYVRQIVRSDAALIQGVREDLQRVEADKRLLEQQAQQNQELAAEFEAQKQQYAVDIAVKQDLLHQTRVVRAQAEGELDELEGEAEEMSDRIRSLSEVLRRRQEAEQEELAARRREARRIARQNHGQDDEPPEPAPTHEFHGDFIKPCEGPFTSGFGYRYHPILHRRRLHAGVDIGAHYGAAIHAAAAGTVILASYSGGYGNCVIIDHGGGVTTLYGHCSALLVNEGQAVHQGQLIARVGATGLATGPHLHFEVRHNGTPVRPPL